MKWAKEAGLTGKSYVWIATQSVIGESKEALQHFPAGMLGKSSQTHPLKDTTPIRKLLIYKPLIHKRLIRNPLIRNPLIRKPLICKRSIRNPLVKLT